MRTVAAAALTASLSLIGPVAAFAATEPMDDIPAIENASAQILDGRLAAEIVTTLPVFREDVRAKLDGRTLVVYVAGAVIPGSKKVFGEGPGAVRALARATYTKLEIPWPQGASCGGTPTIALDETNIKVGLACGAASAVPTRVVKAASLADRLGVASAEAKATPTTDETTTEKAAEPIAAKAEAKPEAKIEAKAESKSAVVEKANPAHAGKGAEPVAAVAPIATVAATPAATVNAVPAAAAAPTSLNKSDLALGKTSRRGADAVADQPAGPRPAASSMPTMAIGALLIASAVAFMLWRRRRDQRVGLIRILETASLGPKRTLVVAEIDGEKMILGTSEAGISVLTPASRMPAAFAEQTIATRIPLPAAFSEETTGTARRADQAALTAAAAASAAVINADDNEGGLLARLFRRSGSPNNTVTETDHSLGNMEDEFRDLLADSIEDEELRRRLQAGLGGRIS